MTLVWSLLIMANGNGLSKSGMLAPPTETAKFKIGGAEIDVPALTLSSLLRAREYLLKLAPDLDWILYSEAVLRIVEIALSESKPEMTFAAMANACSVSEMRALPGAMNDLLRISGFDMGEAQAQPDQTEVLGIGTSGQSLENSLPPESVAETSTG